jgi:hypothetical protein
MEIGLSASGFYSKLMDVSSYQVELVREVLP